MLEIGDPALLTIDDVAARLGVRPSTVESLRRRGGFAPATKIGRNVRWRWNDVEAWLHDQKETS